jgi:potassium-transporting ATPase potassium-binding subunit
VLALLAVFVAGLMVGRTPEFLGKKIRAPQMKLIIAYVLALPTTILILGGISLVIPAGTASILNPGFHGLTEVTYAYASVAQNNGSAFAGLAANTPWYDTTLGLTMLVGRFAPIVLALAIAGSLAGARVRARTRATLDTAGPTFVAFLLGVIVIVGGLIYFPTLILGRSESASSDEIDDAQWRSAARRPRWLDAEKRWLTATAGHGPAGRTRMARGPRRPPRCPRR